MPLQLRHDSAHGDEFALEPITSGGQCVASEEEALAARGAADVSGAYGRYDGAYDGGEAARRALAWGDHSFITKIASNSVHTAWGCGGSGSGGGKGLCRGRERVVQKHCASNQPSFAEREIRANTQTATRNRVLHHISIVHERLTGADTTSCIQFAFRRGEPCCPRRAGPQKAFCFAGAWLVPGGGHGAARGGPPRPRGGAQHAGPSSRNPFCATPTLNVTGQPRVTHRWRGCT